MGAKLRYVYYLKLSRARGRYVLRAGKVSSRYDGSPSFPLPGAAVASWPAKSGVKDYTQEMAARAAGRILEDLAREIGQLSELLILGRDGRLVDARTYPRRSDPKRSRG